MSFRNCLILSSVLFLLSISCRTVTDDFEYVPLESFRYEKAEIEAGTGVRLLAFSGGIKNGNDKVHYSQLLCVTENTGDTIIILSPMVSYNQSDTDSSKIYSPIFTFNPPADMLTASYHPLDSMRLGMLIHAEGYSANKDGTLQEVEEKLKKGVVQHMVIVNKKMPEFAGARYPAVVGVLHFKKSPLKM